MGHRHKLGRHGVDGFERLEFALSHVPAQLSQSRNLIVGDFDIVVT